MSKLFHSKGDEAESRPDELPLLSELQPQIEAEAARLDALALHALAAEVLARAFTTEYEPDAGTLEVGQVVDTFLPPHAEFSGPVWKAPEPSYAERQLRDLIREGLQLLEHAGLLMPKGYSTNGNWYHAGYVTTRLARTALANGSADTILSAFAHSA